MNDLLRLDWIEAQSKLHSTVEILYVINGYEVQIVHDRGPVGLHGPYWGATLREALDRAMEAYP